MSDESSKRLQPPASPDEFEHRLRAMTKHPEYGRCAAYIHSHREQLALARRHDIIAATESSEAKLTACAQALGFLGYSDLRAFLRRHYPRDAPPSAGQVDALLANGENPLQSFLRNTLIAEIRNFEDTYERNRPDAFLNAVQILNAAQHSRVVILGRRSCFSAAHLFHYLYSLFRGNAVLSQDAGGAGVDAVRWLGEGDVLIVISLTPYTREIIQAVAFAQQRGASIVAITDDETSPLARAAAASLFFDSTTPSFFHSLGTLNLIVQALAGALYYSQGKESKDNFERAEQQLAFFNAYARADKDYTAARGDELENASGSAPQDDSRTPTSKSKR